MRDILLTLIIVAALPFMVWRPPLGALAWVGFGLANPHRLTWGFAYTLPFAQAIAVATTVGALLSSEPKKLKGGAAAFVLFLLVCCMVFTTFFAMVPDRAWPMLERTVKVQLGTFIALVVLYKREHVVALMWVTALAIGFYAVKGGAFTIATLGQYRVFGPVDSFITDNNAFALATAMSIPVWGYLYTQYTEKPWLRWCILGAIALSSASVIGSQSRGAVVALAAMAAFLWLKSRRKLALGVALLFLAVGLVSFMPAEWGERIATIANPRGEQSANSRIETWTMLWNLAVDRPFTGGGFEPYQGWIFQIYNPTYEFTHAAHSIYFQMLGEHGFIGLGLFLLFWLLVWRMCSQVASKTKGNSDEQWAYQLAQMIKVSLVAYFTGGAFLNLANWDMPYYFFVAIAITRVLVLQTGMKRIGVSEQSPNRVAGSALSNAPANRS